MNEESIIEFSGPYRFLSNFWPINGPLTVEHYFQAFKSLDVKERAEIFEAPTPGQAKRLGRRVVLREDWEDIKDEVMTALTRLKFASDEELRVKLLDTGSVPLYEGNTWGDHYWGVDLERLKVGEVYGQNRLGHTLMRVRRELRHIEPEVVQDFALQQIAYLTDAEAAPAISGA